MNANGSNPVNLGVEGWSPSFSPDGTKIAFEVTPWPDRNIYVMNADGTNPTDIHAGYDPAWSPDGNLIAFVYGRSIWIMNTDGSNATQLYTSISASNYSNPVQSPTWSSDGSKIAFHDRIDGTTFGISIINSDGSNYHQIFSGSSSRPHWGPAAP